MAFSNTSHVEHEGIGFTISDSIANCYTNGELTIDNLNTVAYCANTDMHNVFYTGNRYQTQDTIRYEGQDKGTTKLPVNNDGSAGNNIYYKVDTSGGTRATIFRNNVLLYCPAGVTRKPYFTLHDTTYYIITEFDTYNGDAVTDGEGNEITYENYFQTLYIDCVATKVTATNYVTHAGNSYYKPYPSNMRTALNPNADLHIFPATVWSINGKVYITCSDMYNAPLIDSSPFCSKAYIQGNNSQSYPMEVHNCVMSVDDTTPISLYFEYSRTNLGINYSSGFYNFVDSSVNGIGLHAHYVTYNATCYNYITDETVLLKNFISCGLKIKYNNVFYKPIINDGTVKDYSDNMDAVSEYDNISNVTGNVVPTIPVVPAPERSDSIDDMELGYTSFISGFVRYYPMTSEQLANLSTALSSASAPTGVMNNIISVKSFPVNTDNFINTKATSAEIKIANWGTGVSGQKITSTKFDMYVGSVYVEGYHGTSSQPHYLDFSPYTNLEMYIPYCNMVEIPTTCMYKNIDVYLLVDIIDGSCVGVVKCDGNIIAQKAGTCASDAVLTATANNERFSALLRTTSSAVNSTVGSVSTGSLTGAVSAISATGNAVMTARANYTKVVGSPSGKVEYAMPSRCYLKRFRIAEHSDSEYTKTFGRPVCKQRTLSQGNGMTVIENYKCNFSATQTEKDELKALFKNGVIL